jgi:hypothetical protein
MLPRIPKDESDSITTVLFARIISIVFPFGDGNLRDRKQLHHAMIAIRDNSLLRIRRLREDVVCRRRRASRHQNILSLHCRQVPLQQPRPQLRIAVLRGNAQQAQLRAAQGQRQSKGVVNVVADVGVENDEFRLEDGRAASRGRLRGGSGGRSQRGQSKQDLRCFHAQYSKRFQPGLAPTSSASQTLERKQPGLR